MIATLSIFRYSEGVEQEVRDMQGARKAAAKARERKPLCKKTRADAVTRTQNHTRMRSFLQHKHEFTSCDNKITVSVLYCLIKLRF